MDDKELRTFEVAKILGVSDWKVRSLIREGRLIARKVDSEKRNSPFLILKSSVDMYRENSLRPFVIREVGECFPALHGNENLESGNKKHKAEYY